MTICFRLSHFNKTRGGRKITSRMHVAQTLFHYVIRFLVVNITSLLQIVSIMSERRCWLKDVVRNTLIARVLSTTVRWCFQFVCLITEGSCTWSCHWSCYRFCPEGAVPLVLSMVPLYRRRYVSYSLTVGFSCLKILNVNNKLPDETFYILFVNNIKLIR